MVRSLAALLTLSVVSAGVACGGHGSMGGSSGAAASGASSGAVAASGGSSGGVSGAATGSSAGSSGLSSSGNGGGAGAASTGAASAGVSGGTSSGAASGSACVPDAGVPGVIGHPDACITYPARPGYKLYLAEEFEQPIDLDNDANWTWSDGGLAEGQVRFTKNQITFQGGNLVLTADAIPQPTSDSFAENGSIGPKPLSSGELRTKYNNYRYGWYEARYRPPTSIGNFISTMFIFRTPKTISWREIDNELTANGPSLLGTNVYFQDNAGNYICQFADQKDVRLGVANVQSDFHVYAFEWTPTAINWYVDDMTHPVRTKTASDMVTNCGNTTHTVAIPELPAKILMNLWIFASSTGYGGDPRKNTYPMSATYDYFRFYKANTGEPTFPCSPTPSCIAHADIILSKNNPTDGVPNNTN